MWPAAAILAFVTLERLAELAWASRNTRLLRAAGAVEVAEAHYPLIVGLHAAWLAGLWALAWGQPASATPLVIFGLLQLLRGWVLLTLGSRWTTRVLHIPGERLVAGGPYRWLRHPNYLVVVGEIAVLPIVFGLFWYAALFSILNAVLLRVRIRAEDAALRPAAQRA
jgi:methyltransferase